MSAFEGPVEGAGVESVRDSLLLRLPGRCAILAALFVRNLLDLAPACSAVREGRTSGGFRLDL